jgi:nuclear pore complex protein Nup188
VKNTAESKDKEQNATKTEKSKATDFHDLQGIWFSWFKDSVLEKLIKAYASSRHNNDVYDGAKVSHRVHFIAILLHYNSYMVLCHSYQIQYMLHSLLL